jgi:dTDP-4-dehydrorhamnose reductase
MKVLVFGASGLLGMVLCQRLAAAGHDVQRFTRDSDHPCGSEAEITVSFTRAMKLGQPDCVINLIAATNVDQCEKNLGHAALLNCFVTQVLSDLCRVQRSHLIQISSDQVYDSAGPHQEDKTSPINVYALTKLVGEYSVLPIGGCVLRTNFFGKSQTPGRSSFSDWLVQGGRNGKRLNVFDDVWFSPLGLDSLSRAIICALGMRLHGLYNLGSANGISKAGFAEALFSRLGLATELLNPVSVASAELIAPRPNDMRMDSSRFAAAVPFELPTIEQEIGHEATHYL